MSAFRAEGYRHVALGVSTRDPEADIAALARARGPLRRVLAALAQRLVVRRAFEPLGFARLGDYAKERLGISARSVQELAKVDLRLCSRPQLEAALVSGVLLWSKVRLLARFVQPEDEAEFIASAAGKSVRALEREFRAVNRGALDASDLAEALENDKEGASREHTECVSVSAPLALQFKWQRTCRYAAQVCGESMPPGSVLEWVTAEALSALPELVDEPVDTVAVEWDAARPSASDGTFTSEVDTANVCASHVLEEEEDPPVGSVVSGEPAPSSAAEPLPPAEIPRFLRPLLAGLDHVDAFEIDARLKRVLRLEQRIEAEMAPLLRCVMSRHYAWRDARPSFESYARNALGMSPRKARALLRIERVGEACPELRAAWRDGALSWVQAQQLARLVARGDVEHGFVCAWVAWAPRVTIRRLTEVVDEALLLRESDPAAWACVREHPDQLHGGRRGGAASNAEPTDEAGPESIRNRQTCAHPTDFGSNTPLRVRAPHDVAKLFRQVLCSVRLGLEPVQGWLPSEAEAFDAMIDHALRAWKVEDSWLKAASRRTPFGIFERDGWRCTVPGCTSRRNLHAHHIVFRSAGGSDAPENLTTLCAFHHQRGVHDGRVRITGRAPDQLWFELGTREGEPPLLRYRSGDQLPEPSSRHAVSS